MSPSDPPVRTFLSGGDRVAGTQLVRNGAVSARWWESFGSPSLNGLVEAGLQNNADLEAAIAAVRVAQANALVLRAGLFPTVTGSFDSTRQKVASQVSPDVVSGADLYSLHTGQLSVSFVPDLFGGTRRAIESAEAQAVAQAFQTEGVYLTLVSNIVLAAIQEASLREQIAVTQRQINLQTQLLGVLRNQNERGQIAMPDVVVQETAVAQAKLLLAPLERQLAQQQNLLAQLTGRFPSEGTGTRFQLRGFRLPRKLPLSLPADLVRQRPDVRAAEENVRATNAQIGVALANRLPQITLTANVGSTATALSQLFAPGTGLWLIGGNVAQTIFDAGAREQRQRAAEAQTVQAAALYRSAVLQAFQNVADTLRALQTDTRAVQAALDAEATSQRNLDLIRKQLDQGQISIAILVPAQQAVLQSSLARVQAQAQRLSDTVALFQSLGGGWWNRPKIDGQPETKVLQ